MSKNTAVTVRLAEDDAERFKTLAQQNGISQADFLVQLMNRYGIAERGQVSQDWQNNIIIYLYIRVWDALCTEKYPDRTLKYEFPEQAVYTPQSFFTRPAKEVEPLLKEDFHFAVPLDGYQFSHVVYLFRDDKAKKYLANEIMLLSKQNNGLMNNYFSLSRCRHVGKNQVRQKAFRNFERKRRSVSRSGQLSKSAGYYGNIIIKRRLSL